MNEPLYPSLYQINTRVWLTDLSKKLGRPATLDDIPDEELDNIGSQGFDWVWFLSVWQTGTAGQEVSRRNQGLREEFQKILPDLSDEDIAGSGFAITDYKVHRNLGGDAALSRLRKRLRKRGIRLMLDFVPNHTALDHPWVKKHPDYYVAGTEQDLESSPQNYTRIKKKNSDLILAYGRDPYFSGWPDTLQLNYGNPSVQDAMIKVIMKISKQCDGVRCDMAMLVLPEVFQRTWQISSEPFWPKAIANVREKFPDFCFMAEVYWDLEWNMLQQGFNYAYDKRLYDRLRDKHASALREHFHAELSYQNKLARFLENHDEPRAAAVFPHDVHEAAATITFLSPGMRFFHQGQFEGRKAHISPHLIRGPDEPVDQNLKQIYDRLLDILRSPVLRNGSWQLLECAPAWEGNWTWDCFVTFLWSGKDQERILVAVNYAPNQSQCYVRLPFQDLQDHNWRIKNLLGDEHYDREGSDLYGKGLYLDLPPWKAQVFIFTREETSKIFNL